MALKPSPKSKMCFPSFWRENFSYVHHLLSHTAGPYLCILWFVPYSYPSCFFMLYCILTYRYLTLVISLAKTIPTSCCREFETFMRNKPRFAFCWLPWKRGGKGTLANIRTCLPFHGKSSIYSRARLLWSASRGSDKWKCSPQMGFESAIFRFPGDTVAHWLPTADLFSGYSLFLRSYQFCCAHNTTKLMSA